MKILMNLKCLLLLTVIASMLMTVLSCSKDTPSAQIEGSWKFANIYVKEGAKAEADQLPALVSAFPCTKEIVFIFQKKGKVSYSAPKDCQSIAGNFSGSSDMSEYEIKDDKLIITGKSTNTFGVTFSGAQMTWTIVDGDGTAAKVTTRIILQKQ